MKLLTLLAIVLVYDPDNNTRIAAKAAQSDLDGLAKRPDTGNTGMALTKAEAEVVELHRQWISAV